MRSKCLLFQRHVADVSGLCSLVGRGMWNDFNAATDFTLTIWLRPPFCCRSKAMNAL